MWLIIITKSSKVSIACACLLTQIVLRLPWNYVWLLFPSFPFSFTKILWLRLTFIAISNKKSYVCLIHSIICIWAISVCNQNKAMYVSTQNDLLLMNDLHASLIQHTNYIIYDYITDVLMTSHVCRTIQSKHNRGGKEKSIYSNKFTRFVLQCHAIECAHV